AAGCLCLQPGRHAFASVLDSAEARSVLGERITLLHCVTEYPSPDEDSNLCAMATLRDTFRVRTGFSDHTLGTAIAVAAAARGAEVIEKHITVDRTLPGPDHRASLEPGEFRAMVADIRRVERALGDGVKAPRPSEAKNILIARKSLVAARAIKAGELFTTEN